MRIFNEIIAMSYRLKLFPSDPHTTFSHFQFKQLRCDSPKWIETHVRYLSTAHVSTDWLDFAFFALKLPLKMQSLTSVNLIWQEFDWGLFGRYTRINDWSKRIEQENYCSEPLRLLELGLQNTCSYQLVKIAIERQMQLPHVVLIDLKSCNIFIIKFQGWARPWNLVLKMPRQNCFVMKLLFVGKSLERREW